METLGTRWVENFKFHNHTILYHPMTTIMTLVVMAILITIAVIVRRKLNKNSDNPGKFAILITDIIKMLYDLVFDNIHDKKIAKIAYPIVLTIGLFVLTSNWIGSFPGVQVYPILTIYQLHYSNLPKGLQNYFKKDGDVYVAYYSQKFSDDYDYYMKKPINMNDFHKTYKISLFSDLFSPPTDDLNTDLGFGLFVFLLAQGFAIYKKGIWKYIKSYFEPVPFLMPLNVIGELAKPISHSFRLFGNIMGGGILIAILSWLLKYFVAPAFLWGYFGLFVGLIQAFVFMMLAIAYISTAID
jgi:F-type H+-transporting ATPase subunit a